MDTNEVSVLDTTIIKYSPFISEIRKRILFTISVFVISCAIGFFYYASIIKFILIIFGLDGLNIAFTSPFQFFSLSTNVAMLVGMTSTLPMVIFQLLGFIKPALKKSEYRTVMFLLPLSLLLFAAGFAFGVVIMKYVIVIFYQRSVDLSIGNLLDVSKLLSQIILTSTLMGLAFQFPTVFTILMRLKILKYQVFTKQRLWVYLASLVFSAFLPPTDLLSLFLMFLPLALLFELTLLLNRYVLKSHLL